VNSSSAQNVSLLLVDDRELVRRGISRLLEDQAGITVIGQAGSGEQALEFLKMQCPDVVLMEVRMSGMGGIEATRKALEIYPDLKIIAISTIGIGSIPSQILRAGASAFVTHKASLEELIKAVAMVVSDQHYVSNEVATQMALDPFTRDNSNIFEKLSTRELQISIMLTDGKKVSAISQALGVKPKTVYSYRYRIFEKLGINSDVELAILAVKYGLSDAAEELKDIRIEESEEEATTLA